MVRTPQLAGAADAGLNLVGDERQVVVVDDGGEFLDEGVGGEAVAALALYRFDDDVGDLVGVL